MYIFAAIFGSSFIRQILLAKLTSGFAGIFDFQIQHKHITDAIPKAKPIHCFFVNFSLNRTNESTTFKISGIPFTIGNIIAASTTPDKNKFIALFHARPIPLITETKISICQNLVFVLSSVFNSTRSFLRHIK